MALDPGFEKECQAASERFEVRGYVCCREVWVITRGHAAKPIDVAFVSPIWLHHPPKGYTSTRYGDMVTSGDQLCDYGCDAQEL